MQNVKHQNNGACEKCAQIAHKYAGGVWSDLWNFFLIHQAAHPEFHISCASRDEVDQEAAFQRGASRAHFGQSAHNYSPALALDTFFLIDGKAQWPKEKYEQIFGDDALPEFLKWYGEKGAAFYELPHFEMVDWRDIVARGDSKLVGQND